MHDAPDLECKFLLCPSRSKEVINAIQAQQQSTEDVLHHSHRSHTCVDCISVGLWPHIADISLAILIAGAVVKQAAWLPSLVESIGARIMYDACKQHTLTW